MASDATRSLQDIRRDTERTRDGLTSSVNELRTAVSDTASDIREKLRPEAIKSEVSEYIRTRGEEMVHNLSEAARRNPMQAVAVGASMAYPLMRIARSIPLPVLMIGAGLFFAGSRKGSDLTQQASNAAADLADEARRRAHDLGDQMTQAAADAKDYAAGAAEQVTGAMTNAWDQSRRTVGAAMETVQDQMGATAQRARDHVKDAAASTGASISARADDATSTAAAVTDKLKTQASQAAELVRDKVTSAVHAGQEYSTATRERLAEVGSRAGRTMQQTVEQNPHVVAGVGILVGGLIASVLPKFDLEDDLLGEAGDAVRRRASEAANEGFDGAKRAADDIVSNVAQKAEEEGLTADGLAKGMQNVGQRLQRVAERGITTAFEPEGADDLQYQTQGGDKQHD